MAIYEEPLFFCSYLWPYLHQTLYLQTVHKYMVHSAFSGQNLCMVHSNSQSPMIPWAHQHQRGWSELCHHQHHEEWRSQVQAAMSCMGASMLTNFSSAVVYTPPEKDGDCQIIFIACFRKLMVRFIAFHVSTKKKNPFLQIYCHNLPTCVYIAILIPWGISWGTSILTWILHEKQVQILL